MRQDGAAPSATRPRLIGSPRAGETAGGTENKSGFSAVTTNWTVWLDSFAGPGLIAEAQSDPELRGAWRDRVLEPLRAQYRTMLDRAVARGEMPPGIDQDAILDLFFGGAEHRLLLGHLPMTAKFIEQVVDIILSGIQRPT